MKTHILTALMALILSACASQRGRDVASVKDQPAQESTSGRADFPVSDGAGDRGGRF